jgi:hypothetical protein
MYKIDMCNFQTGKAQLEGGGLKYAALKAVYTGGNYLSFYTEHHCGKSHR